MAKIIFTLCLVLGLVGCASHYSKSTFKTPTQEGFEVCDEKANGSTSCVRDFEDKGGGYGYGGYGMPYGRVMHPPVPFVYQPEIPAGQRAMERVGGGVLILHPAVQTAPCVDEECSTLPEDVDRLGKVVVKMGEKIDQLESKQDSEEKK
jgi:hypothetical protein